MACVREEAQQEVVDERPAGFVQMQKNQPICNDHEKTKPRLRCRS